VHDRLFCEVYDEVSCLAKRLCTGLGVHSGCEIELEYGLRVCTLLAVSCQPRKLCS